MLKVFRYYIALPVSILAAAETILFLGMFIGLQWVGARTFLADNAPDHVTLTLPFTLTFVAFLCLSAVGMYNRDVFIDVRSFFQRAGIGLLLTIFACLVLFPVYTRFDPVNIEWYLGLFAFTLVIHYPIIIVMRFGLVAFSKSELFKRRILVLGDGMMAARVQSFLNTEGKGHLAPAGFIGRDQFDLVLGSQNAEVPEAFPVGQCPLLKAARDAHADEIVIASKEQRGLPIWQLLECRMAGIEVTDYLTFWEREAGQIDLDEVKPSWMALSNGFATDWLRQFSKRAFDVTLAAIMLFFTFPLLLFTALAIRIDSNGPCLYLQERVGENGRLFKVIKFRSMTTSAEKDGVPQWAGKGDDRVTRVGAFIRRTRIDELPQIINVLRGDMSFVGPRPERPYFVDMLTREIPLYAARHNVKPGITGWAQVNYPYGASKEDAKAKLAYDLYYVKNESMFLDLVILLQTVRVVLMLVGSR
ncbi:MAG: TIGR03013 family PEP-CTERM/XrtA system glycosyltransferase [Alphaproteobacteria bacterium]|nr:MAG: TIGR03013 family PEP-CTERM/XrtA system glycosyltransferase [Alphaproteobacteria bacterium]